jgi:8-oxo-dGTP pyrophosphatase MutT (NUDIX family)
MSEGFVLVWAVPDSDPGDIGCWVMVKHKDRGWELPGGDIQAGEGADVAALRELYEETGLLGVAKAVDSEIVEGGCVVLVKVAESPCPAAWPSNDNAIEEVGWCMEAPEKAAWGAEEVERIRNHDWSTSISLLS